MTRNKKIGDLGENLVKDYLLSLGYEIIAQKWHCPWGEIDLIATQPGWLVFVEVKTRSVLNWDEGGLLAISPAKQKKLRLTAQAFLEDYNDRGSASRFDVALVEHKQGNYQIVTYLAGAFDASFDS